MERRYHVNITVLSSIELACVFFISRAKFSYLIILSASVLGKSRELLYLLQVLFYSLSLGTVSGLLKSMVFFNCPNIKSFYPIPASVLACIYMTSSQLLHVQLLYPLYHIFCICRALPLFISGFDHPVLDGDRKIFRLRIDTACGRPQ